MAQLWASAAHDLRQPAQAALLVTRMLEAEAARKEQKVAARHIASALESLCEMLEVLTLISRIEAGLQVVPLRICRLSEVLAPTFREMAAMAAARDVALKFRSSRELVRTNPKLLVTATRSLLLNALDLRTGERILTRCRRRGSKLRLEVEFDGAVPDGDDKRNAFVQLAPTGDVALTRELGLGLPLLEHLCRRLGHSLQHAKLPRGGQLLAIVLPLAPG
jgi:two-component system CheB/CheR fusion protein